MSQRPFDEGPGYASAVSTEDSSHTPLGATSGNDNARAIADLTRVIAAMRNFDFSVEIPRRGNDALLDELTCAVRDLQRELRATAVSTAHLHNLLESMPNPLAVLDAAGRIMESNSVMQRLLAPSGGDDITDDFLGWANACLPGSGRLELTYWTEPVQVACTLSEVEYHYLFSIAPISSDVRDMERYVVIGTDISARVRMERQLLRAKEMAEAHAEARALFLANMSHEIRTPLHGIIGSAELLLEALAQADTDDVAEHTETVHSCSKHLLALVNDILDFSRIDSSTITLESQVVDLPALLRDCLRSVEQSYRKPGVVAQLSIAADVPRYVVVDPMRLRQIVLNFLGNAFKFTHEGHVELGAVLIEKRDGLAALRMEVRDTGIGIAPDKLDKLFAPFEQVDASITRRYGGTGLGLAIASQLVDLMSGQLGVESEPGHGSTFWFMLALPVAQEPGVDGVVRDEWDGEGSESYESIRDSRVLLVEDNVVSQRIVAMMLAQAGCVVTVAGHGEEALDRLAEAEFDVILMDCQMPVMDGLQATRELRRRERGPRTPVIALTADAFEEHRESCLQAGMDSFVRKPVRKASLCRAIVESLRR